MALPTASATDPYIQVAGKSNLLIAFPDDDYEVCHRLGEQADATQITAQHAMHDVPGDSQGGPQGRPIERQMLALFYRAQFNLTKWDPIVREKLARHNLMAKDGHFAQSEVGALMLRERSFRIVISPTRSNPIPTNDPLLGSAHPDATKDYFFYNFCCCLVSSPIETGQGTKYSALNFTMESFVVPEGHVLAPGSGGIDWADGLIWNRDATGVANAYLPLTMQE